MRYRLTVSAHDLAVALGIETDLIAPVPQAAFAAREAVLSDYLGERLAVAADGTPCRAGRPLVGYHALPADLVLDLRYECPQATASIAIAYRLFFDLDPTHRSIGTIDSGAGPEEYLVDRNFTLIEVALARPAPSGAWRARAARVVLLGVEHILVGIDHVLFLVALLLTGAGFVSMVKVVTSFTVAHSLTLAAAWFGLIDLPGRLTESLIAASVAFVAAQNLLERGLEGRWKLAFAFGLVHGLGFFAVLNELDLERADATTTLFAFNLGVELGQLAILAVYYPALAWAHRRAWYRRAMVAGSAAILALAGYWLIERALFA
ncbi:MAG: HupE/UreJ family protein [Pseudomonadota bacterium]